MKNMYEFSGLKKEKSVETGKSRDIFFSMLDIIENGNLEFSTENFSEILAIIPDGKYWIAQNLVSWKGKKKLFLGRIACAFKHDIAEYIEHLVKIEDLRNFILCPVFISDSKITVLISDEGLFLLYKKGDSKDTFFYSNSCFGNMEVVENG